MGFQHDLVQIGNSRGAQINRGGAGIMTCKHSVCDPYHPLSLYDVHVLELYSPHVRVKYLTIVIDSDYDDETKAPTGEKKGPFLKYLGET